MLNNSIAALTVLLFAIQVQFASDPPAELPSGSCFQDYNVCSLNNEAFFLEAVETDPQGAQDNYVNGVLDCLDGLDSCLERN